MLRCSTKPALSILRCVINHRAPKQPRRDASRTRAAVRRSAIAVLAFTLISLPGAALADVPEGAPDAPGVSGLDFLIVLVLIPAALFVVIAVLAALPSMIRDKGYEPGQSWRSEAEWFGGPRNGVEAADDLSPQQIEAGGADRGGTSGQW